METYRAGIYRAVANVRQQPVALCAWRRRKVNRCSWTATAAGTSEHTLQAYDLQIQKQNLDYDRLRDLIISHNRTNQLQVRPLQNLNARNTTKEADLRSTVPLINTSHRAAMNILRQPQSMKGSMQLNHSSSCNKNNEFRVTDQVNEGKLSAATFIFPRKVVSIF